MAELKAPIIGLDRSEIADLFVNRADAKLRSKQLASHLYKRAEISFDQMADLPAEFRQYLDTAFCASPLETATHRKSSDGVEKLLVHNGDQQVYECVLLPYQDRVSCCLSSQVGCPMGCTFCATGLGGFDRNLTAGEIIGQYLLLQGLSPRRISHVVFMGMGEPLLNLKNLIKAMTLLHEEVGLSYRHLTVSTVGLVPQIKELAKLKSLYRMMRIQ